MSETQQWPASEIHMQPIASLVPYAGNARTHSDEQVSQIVASMSEWGFTNPVLCDEDGGVIAGHGRILAAQELGLEQVPTVVARGWTDAQKRAYVLADNQLAMNAGWDDGALSLELGKLEDDGFDLSLIGFDADALADFLGSALSLEEMPGLPDGDKDPFQMMTFTLHDTQAEQVAAAIAAAKAQGAFVDSPNENSNGNALARVCETFLTEHA